VGGHDLEDRVPLHGQRVAKALVGQRLRQGRPIHIQQRRAQPIRCLCQRRQQVGLARVL